MLYSIRMSKYAIISQENVHLVYFYFHDLLTLFVMRMAQLTGYAYLEENSAVNCNKASPSFSAFSGT